MIIDKVAFLSHFSSSIGPRILWCSSHFLALGGYCRIVFIWYAERAIVEFRVSENWREHYQLQYSDPLHCSFNLWLLRISMSNEQLERPTTAQHESATLFDKKLRRSEEIPHFLYEIAPFVDTVIPKKLRSLLFVILSCFSSSSSRYCK